MERRTPGDRQEPEVIRDVMTIAQRHEVPHLVRSALGEFKRSSQHLKEDCDEETQTLRASRTCAAEVTRETVSAT